MPLTCPICKDYLRPSLGYGTGYWVCNCALRVGISSPQEKQEWVNQVKRCFEESCVVWDTIIQI